MEIFPESQKQFEEFSKINSVAKPTPQKTPLKLSLEAENLEKIEELEKNYDSIIQEVKSENENLKKVIIQNQRFYQKEMLQLKMQNVENMTVS